LELGYDAEKWDRSMPIPVENLDWEELTEKQRTAATLLGYDAAKWDQSDSDTSDSDSTTASNTKNQGRELLDEYEWDELPNHAKNAARELGYDRYAWNYGTNTPTIEQKSWRKLSDKEKSAARTLGYDRQTWNREDNDGSNHVEDHLGWRELVSRTTAFDRESKAILKLAVPFTVEAIIEGISEAMIAAFISKYLGYRVFTAYAMVEVFLSLTCVFSDAVDEASEILIAQALGFGNCFLAGQYVQLSLFLWLIVEVPLYIILFLVVENVILSLGLSAEIAAMAKAYVPVAVLANIIDGVVSSADGLLECNGKASKIVAISSIFSIAMVVAVGLAVIKYNTGLIGVAWISVIFSAAYGVVMASLIILMGWLDPYAKGLFRVLSLKNWSLVKVALKMALPLSFGYIISCGEWEVLTLFAAVMGETEVAAFCIMGEIWDFMETAPSGISSAAVLRIGIHLGKGKTLMARLSAFKSLFYSFIWAAVLTCLFAGFSNQIIDFFTDDETIIDMLKGLVPIIALGNVLMVLGDDAYHILTAQSRAKIATIVHFVCMWCFGIPLSVFFVYARNHRALGWLLFPLMLGYAATAIALLTLIFYGGWKKASGKIIRKATLSIVSRPRKKKGKKKNNKKTANDVSDDYTIMTEYTNDSSAHSRAHDRHVDLEEGRERDQYVPPFDCITTKETWHQSLKGFSC